MQVLFSKLWIYVDNTCGTRNIIDDSKSYLAKEKSVDFWRFLAWWIGH